jgi:hypothetical protein
MIRLNLWCLPPAFLFAGGPWVAASTRHSLRPLIFPGGGASCKNSGMMCRENVGSRALRWLKAESEKSDVVPDK